MDSPSINPARVDFVTLRLFCLVAQSGSITKGASRCHLAVSAASRRLADLEATVGTPLLERSAQGIQLTPAGHVAIQHALRLCQGFDLFGAELFDYSQGYRGKVRLWANMSALTESLPEALGCFMKQHPDIKVDVEEQTSGDIVQALTDGVADIGVLASCTPAQGLSTVPFMSDELVVICPSDHELASQQEVDFAACLRFPFVGLNRGSSLLDLIATAARDAGGMLLLRVQVRSFGAMARMVGTGLGIGVLPRVACEPLLQPYGLKVASLKDPWAQRQLLVAFNPDRALSPAAQLLWTHLSGRPRDHTPVA